MFRSLSELAVRCAPRTNGSPRSFDAKRGEEAAANAKTCVCLPVFGYGRFGYLCVTLPIRVRSRTKAFCGRDRVIYESSCCCLAKEGESSAKVHADRRARLRNNAAVRQTALTSMRRCQCNAALGKRLDQRQVESARRLSDHARGIHRPEGK